MQELHEIQLDPIVTNALKEDWGYGDWTTDICIDSDVMSKAQIICKEDCVVAGLEVVRYVFKKVDPSLVVTEFAKNGDFIKDRTVILEVEGKARSILKAERVALNFFGRLCGIASKTAKFVEAVQGTGSQILDTRKTTPGLRILEKQATVIGGARNHRFGLCDGVMVKENHIRAAGGIKKALARLQESLPTTLKIEVETTNLDEVEEALDANADIIMLDNMSYDEMKKAVAMIDGRALTEASGNVKLETVKEVAECGVNFISTSSFIQSAQVSDLSLLFDV